MEKLANHMRVRPVVSGSMFNITPVRRVAHTVSNGLSGAGRLISDPLDYASSLDIVDSILFLC